VVNPPTVDPVRPPRNPSVPSSTPSRDREVSEKTGPKLNWNFRLHGMDWEDSNEGICVGFNQSPINLITPENAGFASA
jgi:hypothetical protein